jgi:hypothetical protein
VDIILRDPTNGLWSAGLEVELAYANLQKMTKAYERTCKTTCPSAVISALGRKIGRREALNVNGEVSIRFLTKMSFEFERTVAQLVSFANFVSWFFASYTEATISVTVSPLLSQAGTNLRPTWDPCSRHAC